jgi:D-glycero-D-manno-heptose 1,7-bisphosphate phosphatase
LIDGSYYCPDLPEMNSLRRKPAPGMIFEAQRDHCLDLARSYFIGDKTSDIGCGRNGGVKTILVQTGYGAREIDCRADWIARDLGHAAEIILEANE